MEGTENLIDKQLTIGQEIQKRQIRNPTELAEARADRDRWHVMNREIIRQCFTGDALLLDYDGPRLVGVFSDTSFGEDVDDFRKDVGRFLNNLRSIRERLPLFPPEHATGTPERRSAPSPVNIHGNVYGFQHGSGNQQNVVAQGTINVGPTLDELVRLLKDSSLAVADKEDALQAAEDLRTLGKNDSPGRAERVRRRLDNLAAWIGTSSTLASAAAPLLEKLRRLFGIG